MPVPSFPRIHASGCAVATTQAKRPLGRGKVQTSLAATQAQQAAPSDELRAAAGRWDRRRRLLACYDSTTKPVRVQNFSSSSIFCSAFQEFQCINAKCSASTQNGRAQGGCRELDERSSTLLGRNMQLTSTQAAEPQPFLLCLSCEAGRFHPWGVVRET